jgi:hypothetical protein
MISGFCHKTDENCTFLGCYAACSGNSLITFQDNLPVLSWKTGLLCRVYLCFLTDILGQPAAPILEDGINRLSQNVGKELPVHVV